MRSPNLPRQPSPWLQAPLHLLQPRGVSLLISSQSRAEAKIPVPFKIFQARLGPSYRHAQCILFSGPLHLGLTWQQSPSKDRRSCQMGARPEATDSLNPRVFSPVPMHPQAALDGRQFCEAVPPTSHMAVSKSGVFSVWGHFFDKPKCPQMSPSQRAKRKPPR